MAIAEQFAGLDMKQLIGGPLSAAADASALLANSTADFINRVGFDSKGNVRNVMFGYQKRTPNEDGTSSLDEMKVSVPMLAIVPIPNLQIDEVNILFDMEVKQSEKQESTTDMNATVDTSLRLGFVKVNVSGSVSAHQSNTRSTDNSAKYHVDVRATNHGIPEGLARVLDMMAANVAPALVSSSLKDGNGQDLSEEAKIKAERLKALRSEIDQIENRLTAARNGLTDSIAQLKKIGGIQVNVYKEAANRHIKQENEAAKVSAYSDYMEEINQSWDNFQNQAGDYVKLLVDSGQTSEGVSEMFGLKALDISNDALTGVKNYVSGENQYEAIKAAQNKAVEDQKNVNSIENELADKRSEYNDAMSGKKPAPTGTT